MKRLDRLSRGLVVCGLVVGWLAWNDLNTKIDDNRADLQSSISDASYENERKADELSSDLDDVKRDVEQLKYRNYGY